MRFIAKQIPPEWQDTDFYPEDFESGCMYSDLLIAGNRQYKSVGWLQEEIEKWQQNIDDIDDAVTKKDLPYLKDLFPEGSDKISDYETALNQNDMETALKAVTGKPYRGWNFNGCVQSEWQYLYTPDDGSWTREMVDDLAARYWNTGEEWQVEVDPVLVGESEDEGTLTVDIYTTVYDEDDIRAKIADRLIEAGVDQDEVEEVILQKFAGFSKEPIYDPADAYVSETASKKKFVEELGKLFADYGVSQIREMQYEKHGHTEIVKIFDGDGSYNLDVTADSNLAIAKDVVEAIWRH